MFRNTVAVLVCALTFAMGGNVLAQDAPTKNQGLEGLQLDFLPPAEQERMRAALQTEIERAVRQAAGEAEQRLTEQASDQLSAANVAERALDMLGTLATTASERIEAISPDVWRIMVRQQYANGIVLIAIPLLLALLLVVYWKAADKIIKDRDCREIFAAAVPLLALIGVGIALAVCVPVAIARFVNPEYYAIADLLRMIMGGSGG